MTSKKIFAMKFENININKKKIVLNRNNSTKKCCKIRRVIYNMKHYKDMNDYNTRVKQA